LQIIKLEELNFVKSDEKGGLSLTSYGIGACVIVSITIIGGLISIFCMLSMASPYKVANKISYLQSSAKPGTRNKSVASQTFKDRV
jgi:hypothetical protein